jgi:hypothetical protein
MEKIMLNNYTFILTEVNEYRFNIDAESEDEAEAMAWEQFNDGDVHAMNLNLDMERL